MESSGGPDSPTVTPVVSVESGHQQKLLDPPHPLQLYFPSSSIFANGMLVLLRTAKRSWLAWRHSSVTKQNANMLWYWFPAATHHTQSHTSEERFHVNTQISSTKHFPSLPNSQRFHSNTTLCPLTYDSDYRSNSS